MGNLYESDQEFLARYDFDAEIPFAFEFEVTRNARERHLLLKGFVEGHPGEAFGIRDVAEDTGISETSVKKLLQAHPLVRQIRLGKKRDQYKSLAPVLPSFLDLDDGLPATLADLGHQVREDWYYLIEQRRLLKKHKVIRRF